MAKNDMATKSENADIRELQTEMVNINRTFSDFKDNDFKEVKEGVKTLLTKFEEQKNLQTEIDNLREEQRASDTRHSAAIDELKKRRNFISVVVPILVSVFTALLTFLVINFVAHAGPSANNPTTSTTTTVNNPAGSTSTAATKDGTPSTTSSATAHSDAATPSDSQTSNGGVSVTVPKVP